jgi:hypothetical protein
MNKLKVYLVFDPFQKQKMGFSSTENKNAGIDEIPVFFLIIAH